VNQKIQPIMKKRKQGRKRSKKTFERGTLGGCIGNAAHSLAKMIKDQPKKEVGKKKRKRRGQSERRGSKEEPGGVRKTGLHSWKGCLEGFSQITKRRD